MQRLLLYVCGILVLCIGFGCINNKSNVNQVMRADDNILKGLSVVGMYEGRLPCADCSTIATVLSLDDDRRYRMRYIYVGKSEEIFEHEGKWTVDGGILSLENIDYSFKVAKGRLNQLDLSGREIKGELADKYILTKIE